MRDRLSLEATGRAARRERLESRRDWLSILATPVVAVLLVVGTVALRPWGFSVALRMLALALVCLMIAATLGGRALRDLAASRDRARQVVQQTVPGAPQTPAAPPRAWTRSSLVIGLALIALPLLGLLLSLPLVFGVLWLLLQAWPEAPQWVGLVIMGAIVWLTPPVLRPVVTWLRPARARPGAPLLRSLARRLVTLLGCGAVAAVLWWVLRRLGSLVADPLLFALVAIVVSSALGLSLLQLAFVAPFWWVFGALRRADYAAALRRVERLRRLQPGSAATGFLQGTVLLFAGRHAEAELCLRECLARGQLDAVVSQAVALEKLGWALVEQGRYAEAIRIFEASLGLKAGRGGPYHGLAEVYLRQGIEPERALELAGRALEYGRQRFGVRAVDRYVVGEMWANQAWALAMLGRHAEAEQALEQAFTRADRGFKPALAGLYYRAGQVTRLRGAGESAADRFRRACQVDPLGSYGQLAARALGERAR